jgi:NADH:ubiquinone oxidoreductase subunit C
VSFADLCPGVDWAERETYEYFAVEFTGRDNNKPLMLRPGLEAGLNRRQGKKS